MEIFKDVLNGIQKLHDKNHGPISECKIFVA